MNILAWNIRGLVNKPSLRRLKRIIKSNKIACFAIFEPKLGQSHLRDISSKLNVSDSVSNLEGNI